MTAAALDIVADAHDAPVPVRLRPALRNDDARADAVHVDRPPVAYAPRGEKRDDIAVVDALEHLSRRAARGVRVADREVGRRRVDSADTVLDREIEDAVEQHVIPTRELLLHARLVVAASGNALHKIGEMSHRVQVAP